MSDYPTYTDTWPHDYKIRVVFKGFIVANIRHRASSARIGALAPGISICHQPKVHIYQVFYPDPGASGPAAFGRSVAINDQLSLANDFYLTVSGQPQNGIKRFQKDDLRFERFDERHNSRKDFRWFTNLDQIHGITANDLVDWTQLQPKLITNKGVFYTSGRSDGEVRIVKPYDPTNPPATHFAKFATEITARVCLDPNTTAIFRNGDNPIFAIDAAARYRYDIIFDCTCLGSDEGENSDFSLLYPHVISNDKVPREKQLDFQGEDYYVLDPDHQGELVIDKRAISPEVYCMGGNTGGGG